MSAKILYSLSDENPNLQKQIGCMNGFLQIFERRQVIKNRGTESHNRRLTQGENHQGREANGSSKRSKDDEKHHMVAKETRMNPTEPPRASVSSSSGSTLSSQEHDRATKPENPPFHKPTFTDALSRDSKPNQTFPSPNTIHRFPIKNMVIESIIAIGSPIRTPVRTNHVDSPRLNESFRSISSNHSAPLSRNNAHAPRQSYDGTETRDSFVSGLKVRDLPRLSLDSRQRNISTSGKTLNLPEEPGSYRASSNIVAKLMGLETLSDCGSTNQSLVCKFDSLSRSSRTIDESKVKKALEVSSPRISTESSEPGNHSSVTVYGEIERRLYDIDFKKSGKDLRALKQILEAIHREKKAILERRNEKSSFDSGQSEGPQREKQQTIKSPRSVKKDKFVRGSPKEPRPKKLPVERVQFVSTTRKIPVVNKIAKDQNPKPNPGLKALKLKPRHITEVSVKTAGKISEPLSTKSVGSTTKKNSHLSVRSNCRDKKVYSGLPESNICNTEIDKVITSIDRSPDHDALWEPNDNKHHEGDPSDGSFRELKISVQEQPSPVSVLDSAFYEDDSPSPVRKKPTAFQGFCTDDESTETTTGANWKDKDFSYSSYSSMTHYDTNYREQESFKDSSQTLLNQEDENIATPFHKEANLEKAYVAEILLALGFLNNFNSANINNHCAPQLKEPINPNLFFILEHTKPSRFMSDSTTNHRSKTNNIKTYDNHRRKLIFDMVNESVLQKTGLKGLRSQLRTGQQLLQEIYKEINQLEAKSSNQSLDDEDDFLASIIENDLTHSSGNWTDNHNSETSGLVLDIERLIFKDLIVELIHDEA